VIQRSSASVDEIHLGELPRSTSGSATACEAYVSNVILRRATVRCGTENGQAPRSAWPLPTPIPQLACLPLAEPRFRLVW
jgi:hypothetical protein